MWYDINIKEGFFAVFKSAYRKTKVDPVQVVKEISTNEIFPESFSQTMFVNFGFFYYVYLNLLVYNDSRVLTHLVLNTESSGSLIKTIRFQLPDR